MFCHDIVSVFKNNVSIFLFLFFFRISGELLMLTIIIVVKIKNMINNLWLFSPSSFPWIN